MERMEEVRGGRLDVKAEVRHLDTFGLFGSQFNEMVEGLRQRELLRETFGRYVAKQVAEEILAGRVALGGERRRESPPSRSASASARGSSSLAASAPSSAWSTPSSATR